LRRGAHEKAAHAVSRVASGLLCDACGTKSRVKNLHISVIFHTIPYNEKTPPVSWRLYAQHYTLDKYSPVLVSILILSP
jgi:hypothetical protein